MKKYIEALLAVLILAGGFGLLALWVRWTAVPAAIRESKNSFQGRPVRYWRQRLLEEGWKPPDASAALAGGGEEALPVLLELLKDDEGAVRGRAGEILAKLGPKARPAVPVLREALKSNDWALRPAAIMTFSAMGPDAADAVPELVEVLGDTRTGHRWEVRHSEVRQDTSFPYREAAAKALARIGPAALPAVIAAIRRNDDPELQLGAMLTVRKMAREKEAAQAVPALIPILKNDARLAHPAAKTLSEIGPASRDAVPALLVLLKTGTPELRIDAVNALGRIDQDAAFPGLQEALRDKDRFVRMNVVGVFGQYDNARLAIPALTQALKDGDVDVRMTATWSLRHFPKEVEAVRALMSVLKDRDAKVRQHAAAQLGEFGPVAKEAAPALTQALNDDDRLVRETAAYSLKLIDPAADAKAKGH